MAKNFNLMAYMEKKSEKKEEETRAMEENIVNLVPDEENFYSMDGIEELKQSIELVGLLQPLLVSEKDEDGKRTVIAGHRRLMALQQLVSEGKQQYEKVQVIEKKRQDEIVGRLSLIMANRYRDKTEWEKMKETVETDRLLRELKKKVNLKGNMRELIAEISNINTAKVGMYKLIDEKLIQELMEEFKENKIGVTVAYKATQLSEKQQEELWIMLDENGSIGIQDVEKIKNKTEQMKEGTDEEETYIEEKEQTAEETVEEQKEKICEEEQEEKEQNIPVDNQQTISEDVDEKKEADNERTENESAEETNEEAAEAAVNEADGKEETSIAAVKGQDKEKPKEVSDSAKEEIMARLHMLKKTMGRYGMIFDITEEKSLRIMSRRDYIRGIHEHGMKFSLEELNKGLI